jgi:hypothetical protein
MRRIQLAAACLALLPVAANAESITVDRQSSSGGFTQSGTTFGDQSIDLGTVWMPVGSAGIIYLDGLETWVNYSVSFSVQGIGGWDTLTAEILDPVDGDDYLDPAQPSYVPAGYSTSNDIDGFSFAQNAGLERSAVFAGGAGTVTPDETTHRGDILMFSGLSGAESARVTFGVRDSVGDRGFLLRLSVDAADSLATPEPASMLLIGTGLVGIAGAYRRRRRVPRADRSRPGQ